jgi:hypothetical protein
MRKVESARASQIQQPRMPGAVISHAACHLDRLAVQFAVVVAKGSGSVCWRGRHSRAPRSSLSGLLRIPGSRFGAWAYGVPFRPISPGPPARCHRRSEFFRLETECRAGESGRGTGHREAAAQRAEGERERGSGERSAPLRRLRTALAFGRAKGLGSTGRRLSDRTESPRGERLTAALAAADCLVHLGARADPGVDKARAQRVARLVRACRRDRVTPDGHRAVSYFRARNLRCGWEPPHQDLRWRCRPGRPRWQAAARSAARRGGVRDGSPQGRDRAAGSMRSTTARPSGPARGRRTALDVPLQAQ